MIILNNTRCYLTVESQGVGCDKPLCSTPSRGDSSSIPARSCTSRFATTYAPSNLGWAPNHKQRSCLIGITQNQHTTLTITLHLNLDFDRGFLRSEIRILTNMCMYTNFGARNRG